MANFKPGTPERMIRDLRDDLSASQAQTKAAEKNADRLLKKSDEEMLRVKACEHIAEGDSGWGRLRNECPSTAAVASLRDAFAVVQAERDALKAQLARMGEALKKYFRPQPHSATGECGECLHGNMGHYSDCRWLMASAVLSSSDAPAWLEGKLREEYLRGRHEALEESEEHLKWCPRHDDDGEHHIEGGRCLTRRCGKPFKAVTLAGPPDPPPPPPGRKHG